jgi:hypothetical protein
LEAAFQAAPGTAPPGRACSYVPPEEKTRLEFVETIVPTVPPPEPSFFIVPVVVVKLFVAVYLPPPPTAVKSNVPSMSMVLVPPEENARPIKPPAEPLSVNVLPALIELPLSSMVRVLLLAEEEKDTVAELEIVKLLMVAGGTAKTIAASTSITASCAFVGTRSKDQFKAEPHKLSPASPSHVLVVCPTALATRNKLPVSIKIIGRNLRRPGARTLKIGEM